MKKIFTLSSICMVTIIYVVLMQHCQQPASEKESSVRTAANGYVGAQQCQSCHQSEYNEWLSSDHYKSMGVATDSSVLGDFNNVTYTADGVTSRFFKKEEKFFINTQGDDGENHDFEIKYTFGYYPLQQYLIQFPDGRLQVTRDSWDSRKHKWFHQNAGQKIDYRDWLHWTKNSQTWNTMCSDCHSTNVKKNYNINTGTYHTTFSEVNVSCESCHGPGRAHIQYVKEDTYKKEKPDMDLYIKLRKNSSQTAVINACAPCHSLRGEIGPEKINSKEFLDNYIPTLPAAEHYFADGQIKEEDFIYGSFLQSKPYLAGISCKDCHNPHSGKIYFATNKLCNGCHGKSFDSPAHTFHAINSIASDCKSCHMTSRTYMGNDIRYDHSFRVPRPDLSVKYGTPNACNSCHQNKTAGWAADKVKEWYGPERKYNYADDLIPGSQINESSESHLTKLLNDSFIPPIIRATAAHYLGETGSPGSFNALIKNMDAKDAQIRYEVLRSLMNYNSSPYTDNIAPFLNDKVRAVRIAAADLFTSFPKENISAAYQESYNQANNELYKYLLYQADFAHGNISIADYFVRSHQPKEAEKYYLRALKMDSLANLARINLSILYNTEGKNQQALQVLETAARTGEKNDNVLYYLALLNNEMGNKTAALKHFEEAFKLHPANPRLYYNYGLLLQQTGNSDKAISVLESGLKINPGSEDINYALAYIYLQEEPGKALPYVKRLKQLAPDNPDYQPLFRKFFL